MKTKLKVLSEINVKKRELEKCSNITEKTKIDSELKELQEQLTKYKK